MRDIEAMTKRMSRNKITVFNIVSTVILQGLSFFSAPVFSKTLGTTNYGIVSVYYTWVQIVSTVFTLQAANTIAIARSNFPEDEQIGYQSSVLSLATLSYGFFSLLTLAVTISLSARFNLDIRMVIAVLLNGWGLYCVNVLNAKFTYEFKADRNFFLSVSVAVLNIGLSLVLIRRFPADTNYWGRILGQAIVYTLAGILILLILLRRGKTVYNKTYWRFTLPIAIPTIFHLLANLLLNQSDKLMLQQLVDNSSVGVYSLASRFALVMNTIWSAFNNAWVPFYYDYTGKGEIGEMKKHAKNYIELFTVITIGFILLSREVFRVFASEEYWGGLDFLPIFAAGIYFVFLYSFPVNYEFFHKKTKSIATGTIMAAAINIILNYILIIRSGIFGAVVATMISHGFQFLFHFIRAKRIIKEDQFPFRMLEFIPGLAFVFASCAVYYLLADSSKIRWGMGLAAGLYLMVKIVKRKEIF